MSNLIEKLGCVLKHRERPKIDTHGILFANLTADQDAQKQGLEPGYYFLSHAIDNQTLKMELKLPAFYVHHLLKRYLTGDC